MFLLAACASDKLALAPPVGVDLSGQWQLNQADSDDPQHLIQGPINGQAIRRNSDGSGRGGGGLFGPAVPSVSALADALRWPGKELQIKQFAGAVTFRSDGFNRACRPNDQFSKSLQPGKSPTTGRDAAPTHCGWEDKTLVIQNGDPDQDHLSFEERYTLSEDGRRLVEVLGFQGGRSNGFTMSRVWDRANQ